MAGKKSRVKSVPTQPVKDSEPEPTRWRELIWVISVLYLAIAAGFNVSTPYRTSATYKAITLPDIGAPDERAHVNYIRELNVSGFPVMTENPGENYENHQPPLYYLLEQPFEEIGKRFNEKTEGILLRAFSSIIGLFCILSIYNLTRRIYPTGLIPFAAMSFAAFLPMQLSLFSSVNNDCLLELLFITTCYYGYVYLQEKNYNFIMMALAAVMLAILTKTTGILLTPIIFVIWVKSKLDKSVYTPSSLNAKLKVGVIYALMVAWWYRNVKLYYDPFALIIFKKAFAGTAHKAQIIQAFGFTEMDYWIRWIGSFTFKSFWGAFGYLIPAWPLWLDDKVYAAAGVLTIACAAGFCLKLIRPKSLLEKDAFLILVTLLFLVMCSFIAFNLTYAQGQGRYFAPAMPAIAIFFAAGWNELFPSKYRNVAAVGFCVIMVLLSLYALFGVLIPGFETIITAPKVVT